MNISTAVRLNGLHSDLVILLGYIASVKKRYDEMPVDAWPDKAGMGQGALDWVEMELNYVLNELKKEIYQ